MRHDLPNYEPIKQMANGCEVSFDGRRRQCQRLQFDPGRDVERLYRCERRHAPLRTPGHEFADGVRIGAPCVWVADATLVDPEDMGARIRQSHRSSEPKLCRLFMWRALCCCPLSHQ